MKQNERAMTEKAGEKRAAEQQAQVNLSNANSEKEEKVLKAEEQCDVMKLNATAEQERAKRHAETIKTTELNKAKEEALQIRLKADEELKSGVLDSIEKLA